jgi:predicted transcriptional regulator
MDWKTLLEDLQAVGMSQTEIGRELGKSQAWVSATLSGQYNDLKWSDGQALIALHAAKVGAGDTAKEAA